MGVRPARAGLIMVTVAILALSACSDGDDAPPPTTPTTAAATTSTTTGATTGTGSPATTTTTPAPGPTSTAAPAAPPQVTGLTARPGGGSDEVVVTWPPLPDSVGVESYRLYRRDADGTERTPARITSAFLGTAEPDRLGIVDSFSTGPWTAPGPQSGSRCYRVSAVSTGGVEGPLSAEACGSPVGG